MAVVFAETGEYLLYSAEMAVSDDGAWCVRELPLDATGRVWTVSRVADDGWMYHAGSLPDEPGFTARRALDRWLETRA